MTFYDQDGNSRSAADPTSAADPVAPESDSFDDPDVWSEPVPASRPAARPGPRRPGRRDDRAPRRRAEGSSASDPGAGPARGPRRPAPGRRPIDDDDDGYFDMGAESRVPRWLAALLVVGLLLAAVVGGGWWWYGNKVDPPGGPGAAVTVQIPEGASASRVADILASQGVISNATVFNFYVGGKDLKTIQAGSYVFRKSSSFDEAIDALNAGPKSPLVQQVTKVTIPEGYTVSQIVARISQKVPRIKASDLQAALAGGKVPSSLKPKGSTSYEGLLFPATYDVGAGDSAVDVLTMMTQEMEQRVAALGIEEAQAHVKQQWGLDLSAYDMVKVASMIQYEAATSDDAPKIGAVTYNRLEKGMPLQYDSTSIYEAGLRGLAPGSVDYTADTPYNTRTRPGLPPTPIASPGEYALTGAFQPADGPWLYFVLTAPKVVSFSVDYDDFLRDKQKCIDQGLGCG